jgi:hypothetical protein
MKINVTTKHIKMGVPEETDACPIAHAVREAIEKTCLKSLVKDREICVESGGIAVGSLFMTTPQKVDDFIEKFDDKKPVKPFSFVLKFD